MKLSHENFKASVYVFGVIFLLLSQVANSEIIKATGEGTFGTIDGFKFRAEFIFETDISIANSTRVLSYPTRNIIADSNKIYSFDSDMFQSSITIEDSQTNQVVLQRSFSGINIGLIDNFFVEIAEDHIADSESIFSTSQNAILDEDGEFISGEVLILSYSLPPDAINGTDMVVTDPSELNLNFIPTISIAYGDIDSDIIYSSSEISNLNFAVIPIPASLWLFISGIGILLLRKSSDRYCADSCLKKLHCNDYAE